MAAAAGGAVLQVLQVAAEELQVAAERLEVPQRAPRPEDLEARASEEDLEEEAVAAATGLQAGRSRRRRRRPRGLRAADAH